MSRLEDALNRFLPDVYAAMADWGITPQPIDFEIVPADAIYEMASYGMPGHFSHWTYGRDFWRMKQQFESGAGRLYEMIIDTVPPVAYLLESNTLAAQKLVVAHCLGHADLFRHHVLAKDQPKQFHQTLASAAERFDHYRQQYGPERLETVLDDALAIQSQVADESGWTPPHTVSTAADWPYHALWPSGESGRPAPSTRYRLPTADLLGFIARFSPVLAEWERDVLEVVRQEGLYYRPRRQIKMIHEGWATYCHQRLLAEVGLPPGEQIEAARIHAEVAWPHPLGVNPYWFGWRLIQLLVAERGLLSARAVLLEETDASLVRNYLTPEWMEALDLFEYRWTDGFLMTPEGPQAIYAAERQKMEPDLLRNRLANWLGERPPEIVVEMVDADDRLMLSHTDDGHPLDREWAQLTLEGIRRLWGHPVVLYDDDAQYSA